MEEGGEDLLGEQEGEQKNVLEHLRLGAVGSGAAFIRAAAVCWGPSEKASSWFICEEKLVQMTTTNSDRVFRTTTNQSKLFGVYC